MRVEGSGFRVEAVARPAPVPVPLGHLLEQHPEIPVQPIQRCRQCTHRGFSKRASDGHVSHEVSASVLYFVRRIQVEHRVSSLIRDTPLLGPYSRTIPGPMVVLGGGGLFRMGEVPLFLSDGVSALEYASHISLISSPLWSP